MRPRLAFLVLALVGCGEAPAPDAGPTVDAGRDAATDAGRLDADARGPVCDPVDPACGPDEKCTATRWRLDMPWPAPRCTPIAGTPSEPGDACFSSEGVFDNCDAEHACTNYGTGEGFCVPLCRAPGADCEGATPPAGCVTVDPASGFALCLPRCVVDDDCGAPGYLHCVERDGLRVCDAARAAP